jgi:septum formation protein
MPHLILGSTSPRRHQLLTEAGIAFGAARPDIDETPLPTEPADAYVARLSREKALAVAAQEHGTAALILTADTTVAHDGDILGKPEDAADAEAMLRRLAGRAHQVHSGVTVLNVVTKTLSTQVTTTDVYMRPYSDADIAAYIASGDPFGKAGSYAIQNRAFHPVERLQGCYTNVVGLPMCVVCRLLATHGIVAPAAPPCAEDNLPCRVAFER